MKYMFIIAFAVSFSIAASAQDKSTADSVAAKPSVVNKPIYFVDNKLTPELDIAKINPENILSIEVKKGEEALKAYGEKGRYGVVLITMKLQPVEKSKALKKPR